MLEIAFFVEDDAHRQIIGALVSRIAEEFELEVRSEWRNATGGYAQVVGEFRKYLSDIERQGGFPDLILVATDANCKGLNERAKEVAGQAARRDFPAHIVYAIPDPHIERWLLLDGAAFKAVFGQGCSPPDQKCERNRYKRRLVEAIRATGASPILGGIEYAEDIVRKMDMDRSARADRSLGRFVESLRDAFKKRTRQEAGPAPVPPGAGNGPKQGA